MIILNNYLTRKSGRGIKKGHIKGNVFFPIYTGQGSCAYCYLGKLFLPKEKAGKRFRLRVEWLDDEVENETK